MQHRYNIIGKLKFTSFVGFVFSVFMVFSLNANAQLKLVSHSSVHNFTEVLSGTSITLYAGMTNMTGSCTSSPCNSCDLITTDIATAGTTACNTMEIRPAIDAISFTINTPNTAFGNSSVVAIKATNSSSNSTDVTLSGSSISGGTATVSALWKDICIAAGGVGTSGEPCTKSFSTTLTIGWSDQAWTTNPKEQVTFAIKFRYVKNSPAYATNCKNSNAGSYEGFCYFTAYPGDGKAYIFPTMNTTQSYAVGNLETGALSGADASGMNYAKMRVCWKAVRNGPMLPGGSSCEDLTLDSSNSANPTTSPMYISGLSNDVPYYFNIASMDQAGIVTYFMDPTGEPNANFSWDTTVTPPMGGTQAAIPGPVYGLLDGQSCFIATAAYGSILAPEVNTFRKFRSEYLLKSELGKSFVRTYYKYSPPLADFIAQHEVLRFVARVLLFPILIFVKTALWLGVFPALSLLAGLILLSLYLQRRRKAGGVI